MCVYECVCWVGVGVGVSFDAEMIDRSELMIEQTNKKKHRCENVDFLIFECLAPGKQNGKK